MRCEDCRYWDNSVYSGIKENSGACRVMPPRADKRTNLAVWPFTEHEDWCGAFVAADDAGS